ncbi:MAG: hypothetical protein JST19_06065 [Bacteroidetes bacterium]|nr:hypothetical protein [Bacteroidota bacterium]
MIEKTLKTTHGKLRVSIPGNLNEMTLGQLMALQEKEQLDDLDTISILSNIPRDELGCVRNFDDFGIFGEHVKSLANQIYNLHQNDMVPGKVTFTLEKRSVKVNVIRNLSVEPAGAFLAARDIIANEINEHVKQHGEENFQPSLKACCHVLAHYFFCRVTGKKYDEYEAEEFCEEVKKLRVTEALPIARHFFTCYPNLSRQRTGFLQTLRQYWRKRQVSRLLRNLNT